MMIVDDFKEVAVVDTPPKRLSRSGKRGLTIASIVSLLLVVVMIVVSIVLPGSYMRGTVVGLNGGAVEALGNSPSVVQARIMGPKMTRGLDQLSPDELTAFWAWVTDLNMPDEYIWHAVLVARTTTPSDSGQVNRYQDTLYLLFGYFNDRFLAEGTHFSNAESRFFGLGPLAEEEITLARLLQRRHFFLVVNLFPDARYIDFSNLSYFNETGALLIDDRNRSALPRFEVDGVTVWVSPLRDFTFGDTSWAMSFAQIRALEDRLENSESGNIGPVFLPDAFLREIVGIENGANASETDQGYSRWALLAISASCGPFVALCSAVIDRHGRSAIAAHNQAVLRARVNYESARNIVVLRGLLDPGALWFLIGDSANPRHIVTDINPSAPNSRRILECLPDMTPEQVIDRVSSRYASMLNLIDRVYTYRRGGRDCPPLDYLHAYQGTQGGGQ
ncbi:MAG: hypothetical protein FWD83_06865 [Promicromonosporaceae bacterium]|nr:hypothetical protein [Promicromonosporaceae bacterium]